MILRDYPGHLIAALCVILCAAALWWAFRSNTLHRLGVKRWAFALLVFLPMLILLWIQWNPSQLQMTDDARPCTVQVFFDTSQSMSIQDMYKQSRLDYARELFKKELLLKAPQAPSFQIYGFDQTCYAADSLETLAAKGKQSNLNLPWEQIYTQSTQTKEDRGAAMAAGAIVFTDGQADVQTLDNYPIFKNKDFPVLLIPVGSEALQPDLEVTTLKTPAQSAVNTTYPASATIRANQLQGRTVQVDILQNDHVILSKVLTPDKSSQEETVDFELSCSSAGLDKIEVVAQTTENELNRDNNRKINLVNIIAGQRRKVLLYSQVACFDLGKIRQALERDEKIDLDFRLDSIINPVVVQNNPALAKNVSFPEPNQLDEYDVLVLGSMNFNSLSESKKTALYRFVADRGGAIILLPGKDQYALPDIRVGKIRSMLPVVFHKELADLRYTTASMPATLTHEGLATDLISKIDLASQTGAIAAAYLDIAKKPAASTWLQISDTPLLCVQRLGRGYVSFLNSFTLFRLYHPNAQNNTLQEILSTLIAYSGRIGSEESRIDLSATVNSPQSEIVFEACVRGKDYQPVLGANVLLDVNGQIVKMQPSSSGRYRAILEDFTPRCVYAVAKAESSGTFLGQKSITLELPPKRDEMSRTSADKLFLTALAKHTNATLLNTHQVNGQTVEKFKAQQLLKKKAEPSSIWHNWFLLLLLCGLLILNWFLRRSAGMV